MFSSRIGTAVVASTGIAIAAGVGYALLKTKQSFDKRAVVMVLGDATQQLKGAQKGVSPEALDSIERHLRVAKHWSNRDLAEATEGYLVGAREILRRRADANRLTRKAAASRAALSAHMDRAAQRDLPWIRAASALKKQVERDHFDLDVQLKALANLIDLLPEANKRLAPHVQASLLLEEEARRSMRREVLEEAKRAAAQLGEVRSYLR
jgi:hypothetical protein